MGREMGMGGWVSESGEELVIRRRHKHLSRLRLFLEEMEGSCFGGPPAAEMQIVMTKRLAPGPWMS